MLYAVSFRNGVQLFTFAIVDDENVAKALCVEWMNVRHPEGEMLVQESAYYRGGSEWGDTADALYQPLELNDVSHAHARIETARRVKALFGSEGEGE